MLFGRSLTLLSVATFRANMFGMARPKVMKPTAGQAIRQRREELKMSLDALAYAIRPLLPRPFTATDETIRNYERGRIPADAMNPVIVGAIAQVLGMRMVDISSEAAESMEHIKELSARSRCTVTAA